MRSLGPLYPTKVEAVVGLHGAADGSVAKRVYK